jgi:hypothetical protein
LISLRIIDRCADQNTDPVLGVYLTIVSFFVVRLSGAALRLEDPGTDPAEVRPEGLIDDNDNVVMIGE